jgi:molybdopterin biosynthesis enzyme
MDFKMELAVTRSEALELLYEHWDITPQTEFVSLSQALGRVTAKTYYACNTLPVCRSSMVDGIAVKSAAFGQGIPDTSTWQKYVDFQVIGVERFEEILALALIKTKGEKLTVPSYGKESLNPVAFAHNLQEISF